jgi:hypothetical protein
MMYICFNLGKEIARFRSESMAQGFVNSHGPSAYWVRQFVDFDF